MTATAMRRRKRKSSSYANVLNESLCRSQQADFFAFFNVKLERVNWQFKIPLTHR